MEKNNRFKILTVPFLLILAVSMFSYTAFADIGGRTGRTLKTSTSGCSCHSSRDLTTNVTISGPSTVTTGSTSTYTLTISRTTKTGAGCNISARTGTLNIVSTTIHKSGLELTHNNNIPMVSNSVSVSFSYTAPASPLTDTIFATGLATNSSGDEIGDLWNWAPSFRVTVIPPPKILHLTVLIEGFFNPGSGILIRDTVRVYLRNTTAPYAIVDQAKGYLDQFGKADFSFNTAANSTPYYVVVQHRNSIETWSAGGNSFVSNSLTYDFTTASSKAYGSNMQLVGAKWTIFSGDENQDGTVDASDLSDADNDALNSLSGYVPTDVNGDEFVDAGDVSLIDNNGSISVSVIRP